MSENTVGDPENKLVFERKSLTDLVPYFYGKSGATGAVSYTHLTLPTILLV